MYSTKYIKPPKFMMLVVLIALVTAAWSGAAVAGGKVNTGYFGGVAIKGYDPVAYFTESRAVKGLTEFSHQFLGETWQFASADNRDVFAANPVRYAPQYGGYCAGEMHDAGTVGFGITTNIDPEAWRIIDDKLYLFYRKSGAEWFEQNHDKTIPTADANWPAVSARLTAE